MFDINAIFAIIITYCLDDRSSESAPFKRLKKFVTITHVMRKQIFDYLMEYFASEGSSPSEFSTATAPRLPPMVYKLLGTEGMFYRNSDVIMHKTQIEINHMVDKLTSEQAMNVKEFEDRAKLLRVEIQLAIDERERYDTLLSNIEKIKIDDSMLINLDERLSREEKTRIRLEKRHDELDTDHSAAAARSGGKRDQSQQETMAEKKQRVYELLVANIKRLTKMIEEKNKMIEELNAAIRNKNESYHTRRNELLRNERVDYVRNDENTATVEVHTSDQMQIMNREIRDIVPPKIIGVFANKTVGDRAIMSHQLYTSILSRLRTQYSDFYTEIISTSSGVTPKTLEKSRYYKVIQEFVDQMKSERKW